MIPLSQLQWRHGKFDRRLWRQLLRAIGERTIRGGRNVRVRRMSDGLIVRSVGGQSDDDDSYSWQMSLDQDQGSGDYLVTMARGLVNGTEPLLAGQPMSTTDPTTGLPLPLNVTQDDFGPDGVSRIYGRIAVAPDWSIDHIDLIALPQTPDTEPWTDYMLIGLLITDSAGNVTIEQRRYFDQQWAASDRHDNGYATYLRGAE